MKTPSISAVSPRESGRWPGPRRYDTSVLSSGEIFAGYRIVRRLGAGGMGEVYLADHPRLSRQDAIKVLSAELSVDDEFAERFRREADLSAGLWHPHIVGVHDRGEFDGRLWISMDFVDGTDAARLLAANPSGLLVADVADIVEAIASGLDFAHHRGLLHRDVKPANILVAAAGEQRRVLLADFGIGREIGSVSGLTATNMTIGTVSYAAPEQLMGVDIDGRADQYALAATAYHLLTGGPVFDHSNPTVVISRHLTSPPAPLSQRHPELAPLDPALLRALAKDPADRFPTCSAFAAELRALAAASAGPASPTVVSASTATAAAAPTQPAPIPDVERPEADTATGTSKPRKPYLVAAGVTAAVVVVVGVVAAILLWPRPVAPQADSTQAIGHPIPSAAPAPTPASTVPIAVPPPPAPVPPPPRAPATAVQIPSRSGSAFVITRSGRTACQVRAEDVGCQVQWEVPTPLLYGAPANGVRTRASGDWEWVSGDMGSQSFTTLAYGTTYRTLGWTITPTADATTFTHDVTGHGMRVSAQGVDTF